MLWYDSKDWAKPGAPKAELKAPRPLPPEYVTMLNDGISGDVLWPGGDEYNVQRHVSNPAFNNYPTVIVMCESEDDVALCLKVARESGFPAVGRSGGHSTAGFSSPDDTIVINISRMVEINISNDQASVWVDVGCNFGTLNARLEQYNLHTPGGACPDVCIGGYMQGGGYGFTARIFGLNCDQLLEAKIMTTDGVIRNARPDGDEMEKDLFWAIKGGTGSNFGILLKVCFKLQPSADFAGFSVRWDLFGDDGPDNGATALNWLQENFTKSQISRELGYQMIWVFEGPEGRERKPYLLMRGMYKGSREEMLDRLDGVLNLPGAVLEYEFSPLPYTMLNKILLTTPYEVPQFPASVKASHSAPPESKLSRILKKALKPEDWKVLIEHFLRAPNPYTIVAMEMYGAAINEIGMDDTAFVHRDDYCDLFCDVFWLTEEDRAPAEKFIAEWEDYVEPFWDGAVYQNYPRVDDHNFARQFWTGEAYERLVRIKRRVDPDHVLRFSQSIGMLGED